MVDFLLKTNLYKYEKASQLDYGRVHQSTKTTKAAFIVGDSLYYTFARKCQTLKSPLL